MNELTEPRKNLESVFSEIKMEIEKERLALNGTPKSIKDFRKESDQESERMNEAIYNNQTDKIRKSCLKTIAALIEILSRA